jgi:hypothetical protein
MRCGSFISLRAQAADGAVEGGAEHQGLARLGQHGGDGLDVLDETEVEHAVGFVEHQSLDLAEHGRVGAGQVHQAARGGNDEVGAGTQALQLLRVGHAAHHGGDREELDALA